MVISITGIIINVVILIIILVVIILGLRYNSELKMCETKQSTFCYSIQCPCDVQSSPPCFGYAKRPTSTPGQWNCSNAPLSTVDNNGNIV